MKNKKINLIKNIQLEASSCRFLLFYLSKINFKERVSFLILLLLFGFSNISAQTGKDGSITVSTANTVWHTVRQKQ